MYLNREALASTSRNACAAGCILGKDYNPMKAQQKTEYFFGKWNTLVVYSQISKCGIISASQTPGYLRTKQSKSLLWQLFGNVFFIGNKFIKLFFYFLQKILMKLRSNSTVNTSESSSSDFQTPWRTQFKNLSYGFSTLLCV